MLVRYSHITGFIEGECNTISRQITALLHMFMVAKVASQNAWLLDVRHLSIVVYLSTC